MNCGGLSLEIAGGCTWTWQITPSLEVGRLLNWIELCIEFTLAGLNIVFLTPLKLIESLLCYMLMRSLPNERLVWLCLGAWIVPPSVCCCWTLACLTLIGGWYELADVFWKCWCPPMEFCCCCEGPLLSMTAVCICPKCIFASCMLWGKCPTIPGISFSLFECEFIFIFFCVKSKYRLLFKSNWNWNIINN